MKIVKNDAFSTPEAKNKREKKTIKKATPAIFVNDATSSNKSSFGLITQEKYESLKAANPPPG